MLAASLVAELRDLPLVAHRRLLIILILLCGLLWLSGPIGRFLVAVPLVLFAPGFLIERAIPLDYERPLLVRPAIWLSSSLSLIPMLYAWAGAVHLPLTTPLLMLGFVVCGGATAWLLWRSHPLEGRWRIQPVAIACALVFAVTLGLRLYEIRDEALPLWVDSVHHALLVRVVGETGAIPLSLRPYLPVDTLPYHWGYHVVLSMIIQLSGLPLPEAMLWEGQVLNALQALTVAALAATLWRSNIAGLASAVVVGLISLMPAYLVTWGRYTLLEGLLILPMLLIASLYVLRRPTWSAMAQVALLTAGLLCTHYIISVFAIVLIPLLTLWYLVFDPQRANISTRSKHPVQKVLRQYQSTTQLLLAGVAGALLAVPWLWILVQQVLARYVGQGTGMEGGANYNAFSEGLLWAGQNRLLFALATLALLLTLWRRLSIGLMLMAWPLLLLLFANPVVIGLPYTWLVTNTEVLVSLYLPVATLIGGGAHVLWTMETTTSRGWRAALVVLLAGGGLAGAFGLRDVINPVTRNAGAADLKAITWAAEHTPPDARFLVSATDWLPTADRGGDGGWWLMPLAGRWTTTPPVLFTYAAPTDVAAILARTHILAAASSDKDTQIEAMIQREHINYVYIGSLETSLKAAPFDANPAYQRVYDQNGIVIFKR